MFCKQHASEGMENVRRRRCEHPGGWCTAVPSYGEPGGRPMYCRKHAAEGMEDVRRKRCEHPGGCKAVPCFGRPGERATLCRVHAAEGMEYARPTAASKERCVEGGWSMPGPRGPARRGAWRGYVVCPAQGGQQREVRGGGM